LKEITLNTDILSDDKYRYLYTVEVVNDLVSQGLPFRDAYQEVNQRVAAGNFVFEGSIQHSHAGSIGNLCLPQIREKLEITLAAFDFEGSIERAESLLKQ
jgi:argininosuccinate lyase